jgi:hypothetical protein
MVSFSVIYGQINPIIHSDTLPFKDTLEYKPLKIEKYGAGFFSFGITGSGNYNLYKNSSGSIDDDLSEISFHEGKGFGYSVGVFAEVGLFKDLSIELKMLIKNKSGKMKGEYSFPIYNDRYAKTEHDLKINLSYYAFDLLLKYNFYSHFHLSCGASYEIPKDHKYSLKVSILSNDISYDNNANEKTFDENPILNTKDTYSLLFGLDYDIFITDMLFLSPGIQYEYSLNPVKTDTEWKITRFNGSIKIGLKL